MVTEILNKQGKYVFNHPLDLLLNKEKHALDKLNPCLSCPLNDSTDPFILDFCHYNCDK